jgi:toxin CcdB
MIRQFGVYANTNPRSREAYPFLLCVQHDMLAATQTRSAIPMTPRARRTKISAVLHPVISVKNEPYVLITELLSVLPIESFGDEITFADDARSEIQQAIDFLFWGY